MSSGEQQNGGRRHEGRQHDSQQPDAWEVCPAGELTQLVGRLDAAHRRVRRRQVLGTALVSTGIFACVVLALGTFLGPSGPQYGGISCSYCVSHMPDYYPHAAGKIVHQDTAFVASMQTHLEKCILCRDKFYGTYPDLRAASARAASPVIVVARQPLFAVARTAIY